jgi:ribulose-phosphate 3-epimerase
MISEPEKYVADFAKAGVDGITIHVEIEGDVGKVLDAIGDLGLKRGVSLRPGTPVEAVLPFLGTLDLVLVMSVEPGFGGQAFDPGAVEKIAALDASRQERGTAFLISVDGGINAATGAACRQAGADILVSGSWLLGADDRPRRARLLRG